MRLARLHSALQTGMQVNQFSGVIDRAASITNFTKNWAGKSFVFFLKTQKRLVLNFLCLSQDIIRNDFNFIYLSIYGIHH